MFRNLILFAAFALLSSTPSLHADDWGIGGEVIPDNCGRFTLAPGGGENLVDAAAGNEYRLHIWIWDQNGDPVTTLAPTDIWADRPGHLSPCYPIFNLADDGTDATGYTTISGTIYGGVVADATGGIDCNSTELYVYALGLVLNDNLPVCVAFDSPDLNGDLAVTIADFALFATDYNCTSGCDPCHDYNEDGITNIMDFAAFAGYFNASVCP